MQESTATPETGPVDAPAAMDSVLAEFAADAPKPDDDIESVVAELKVKEPEDDGQADEAPATEESATEPTDEAPPEADATQDEADDTPPADEPRHKVKVNGEEKEVPLSELLNGYSRTEDYKAKTMALADERRQLEQAKATVEVDVQRQYANDLKQTIADFEALDPVLSEARQIDWDRLKAEDPATYVQYSDAVQQRLSLIEGHRAKLAQIEQQNTHRQTEAAQAEIAQRMELAANKIVEMMPELREGSAFQEFANSNIGYLRESGFTPDEISEAIDDRAMIMADKARRWDALQRAKTGLPAKKIVPKSSVKTMTSDATDPRTSRAKLKPGASRDDAIAFALKELQKE